VLGSFILFIYPLERSNINLRESVGAGATSVAHMAYIHIKYDREKRWESRGVSHQSEYSEAYSGSFDVPLLAPDDDISPSRCGGVYVSG
jgi:hypothetical protein